MEPKAKRRKLLSLNRSRVNASEPTPQGPTPSAYGAGSSVLENVSLTVGADERKLASIATTSNSPASCVLSDHPVNAAVSTSRAGARQPSTCIDLTDEGTGAPIQSSSPPARSIAQSSQPSTSYARPRVSSEQDFDDSIRDGFGVSVVSRSAAKPVRNKNGGYSQMSQAHKKANPLLVRAPVSGNQSVSANAQPHATSTTKPARTLFRRASQDGMSQPPMRVASSSRHPKTPRGPGVASAYGSPDETCSNSTQGEPNREAAPSLDVKANLSQGAAATAATRHIDGAGRATAATRHIDGAGRAHASRTPALSAPQSGVQQSQPAGDQYSQCLSSFSAQRWSEGQAASSLGTRADDKLCKASAMEAFFGCFSQLDGAYVPLPNASTPSSAPAAPTPLPEPVLHLPSTPQDLPYTPLPAPPYRQHAPCLARTAIPLQPAASQSTAVASVTHAAPHQPTSSTVRYNMTHHAPAHSASSSSHNYAALHTRAGDSAGRATTAAARPPARPGAKQHVPTGSHIYAARTGDSMGGAEAAARPARSLNSAFRSVNELTTPCERQSSQDDGDAARACPCCAFVFSPGTTPAAIKEHTEACLEAICMDLVD